MRHRRCRRRTERAPWCWWTCASLRGSILLGRRVGVDHDTGRKSPRFQELEIDRIREERHAPNKRDGMNHQPVLVDKALLGEELCKPCASGNADVLTGLLLELGDFFGGEPVASLKQQPGKDIGVAGSARFAQ